MAKTIENVTLVEIRGGNQLYRWSDDPQDCLWLCGWDRHKNAKVGDTGRLVYRTGLSYGLYFFEKGGDNG